MKRYRLKRSNDPGLLPDPLDDLVDRFASALRQKLKAARIKHDHHDEKWRRDDWVDDLRRELREHVAKGDPLDVTAYCAFAWHHRWSIAPNFLVVPGARCPVPGCDGVVNADGSTNPCGRGGCPLGGDF